MKTLLAFFMASVCAFAQQWVDAATLAGTIGATNLTNPLAYKPNQQVAADPTARDLLNGTAGRDYVYVTSTGKLYICTVTGTPCGTWAAVEALTFSTGVSRSANAVICLTASGSTFGCLLAADFTTFTAKFGATTKIDVLQAAAFCLDAGSTDAYACSLSPAITAYVLGTHYRFRAATINTGAATINLNALGALTIKKPMGGSITSDLADGDIRAGQWVECVYDGTNCQMVSQLGNSPASGSISGLTANKIPKAVNSTTIGDGPLTVDATTNQVTSTASINGAASTSCASGTTGSITIDVALGNRCEVGTLTGDITAVTFSHLKPGLEFTVAYTQAGSAHTVTYGASVVTNTACAASATTGGKNWQEFKVSADGSTVTGGSCGSDDTPGLAIPCTASPVAGQSGSTMLTCNSSTGLLEMNRNAAGRVPIMGTASDVGNATYAAGGGTANAQTVTLAPAISALTAGLTVRWLPSAGNTGATTLAVNGLTATALTKCGTTALASGDLTTTAVAIATHDGTRYQLINPQAAACGASSSATGFKVEYNSYGPSATVSNTTTATDLMATGTLPANELGINQTYHVVARGHMGTAGSSALVLTLLWNSTELTHVGYNPPAPIGSSEQGWTWEADCTATAAAGASVAVDCHGDFRVNTAANAFLHGSTSPDYSVGTNGLTNQATNATAVLKMKAQWGAGVAANDTITQAYFTVQRIN